jgi:hypothetical protein
MGGKVGGEMLELDSDLMRGAPGMLLGGGAKGREALLLVRDWMFGFGPFEGMVVGTASAAGCGGGVGSQGKVATPTSVRRRSQPWHKSN